MYMCDVYMYVCLYVGACMHVCNVCDVWRAACDHVCITSAVACLIVMRRMYVCMYACIKRTHAYIHTYIYIYIYIYIYERCAHVRPRAFKASGIAAGRSAVCFVLLIAKAEFPPFFYVFSPLVSFIYRVLAYYATLLTDVETQNKEQMKHAYFHTTTTLSKFVVNTPHCWTPYM